MVKISKIEAARRQIDTAIKLFFNDQDKISIHTLSCAAHGILNDVGKKIIYIESLHEAVIKCIKPEKKKEILKKINEARNFFKHADKEGIEKILDYKPEVSDFWLIDCLSIYEQLTGEITDNMKIFLVWFNITHKDLLTEIKQIKAIEDLEPHYKNRMQFYQEILPLVHKII